MSRTSAITITSDLTGRSITYQSDTDAPKEVKLSLNGKSGTIDLPADELAALETLIASGDASELRKLITDSSTVPSTSKRVRKPGTSSGAAPAKSASPELEKVREWGKANGFKVSDRGRIGKELTAAYSAAHGQVGKPASEPAADAAHGQASEPAA